MYHLFRVSTLPTINQVTTVLGTVFGGTKTVQNIVNLGTTIHRTTTTTGTTGVIGIIMWVGGGVGDFAADVTYSTKPNAQMVYGGLAM